MSNFTANTIGLARYRKRSHRPSIRQFQPGNDGWYGKDQPLVDILTTTAIALKERYGSQWLVQRMIDIDVDFWDAMDDGEYY